VCLRQTSFGFGRPLFPQDRNNLLLRIINRFIVRVLSRWDRIEGQRQ
jgi:hypothetical protein